MVSLGVLSLLPLSVSLFFSFSNRFPLILHSLTPRSPLSHMLDDLERVVRSSREPPLFFHHLSPNRDLTYPRRRTAIYSHSRPTCRIIRNSLAKIAVRRVPVLSKCEYVQSHNESAILWCVLVVKILDRTIQISLKLTWTFVKIDPKENQSEVWILRYFRYFEYRKLEDISRLYCHNTFVSF